MFHWFFLFLVFGLSPAARIIPITDFLTKKAPGKPVARRE